MNTVFCIYVLFLWWQACMLFSYCMPEACVNIFYSSLLDIKIISTGPV